SFWKVKVKVEWQRDTGCSLPVQNSASSLWNRLQDQISKHSFDIPLYSIEYSLARSLSLSLSLSLISLQDLPEGSISFFQLYQTPNPLILLFNIPNLRIGTLDPLLSLSDDLLKNPQFLNLVLWQIGNSIAKFSIHLNPISKLFDSQIRVAEYNNVRSQLNAINRKQSGSLAVRDLSNLVKPEDIITSEHLVTLLAIVPKYSQKDWLASYETLTSYVVPRSSKKLYEDNEYALYTVTLFGRVADNFRTAACERGFQIRDFEYSPEAQESRKQELEKLMQDQGSLRSSLLQWCYNSYGDVFSSWMHFCAVRFFAESILRYGLPPSFLACVLAPSVKSEKKVRSILEGLCDSANRQVHKPSANWKTEDEAGGGVAGLAGDADAHPYVSFIINLI
ncbi:v-type proton atpase subunit c, partial [Quercus suber]